jgi:hypothetical protein
VCALRNKNLMRKLNVLALLCALVWALPTNAQAPFYLCQIVVPNPPATSFAAPAPGPTICPINPAMLSNGAGVALILNFSSGAVATASVQVTGDPQPSTTVVWNNHDTLVNQTTSANGNIAFPVTAVRLYLPAYTSGTITLDVVESAIPR